MQKTYQIVFGITPKDGLNLHKVLDEMEDTIKLFSKEHIKVLKTCWVVRTDRSGTTIRDNLTKTLKKNGTDGNILITDIELTEWCAHCDDNSQENRHINDWLRKYVSSI